MAFTKNPPSLATGRVSNSVVDLLPTPDQIAQTLHKIQKIRVAHVARRKLVWAGVRA
jgi:hypothetical protein